MDKKIKIAIIGGTGLEHADILQNPTYINCTTPFGQPSDSICTGTIDGVKCYLLARHGRQHDKSPTNINYRANIWSLFQLGVTHIIVSTACGSLRDEIAPGDLVFIDQFIDRTNKRESSFYDGTVGNGRPIGVCHIPMDPVFDPKLRNLLIETAKELNYSHHVNGTAVCIEGPRYSTKAESNLFRSWNASIVNMTVCPEAVLARELGLIYASTAIVTDYDCWRDDGHQVSVDLVMKTFAENCNKVTQLFRSVVNKIPTHDWTKEMADMKKMAIAAVMLPSGVTKVDHLE